MSEGINLTKKNLLTDQGNMGLELDVQSSF